jgi:hypothetical protein
VGFANAFDEVNFPDPGIVVGEPVEVLSVGVADRPALIATCTRDRLRYAIALLDLAIETNASTSRLIAAYRGGAAYCWAWHPKSCDTRMHTLAASLGFVDLRRAAHSDRHRSVTHSASKSPLSQPSQHT